jgi:predicted dehydrogenase/nucleoside-diphosphate-sugar epimerase
MIAVSRNNIAAPVRIAIVGCGAVTEGFHLPVLAGHPGVVIAALVDPDLARAQRLASLYHVPVVLPSIDTLDATLADAALLATPPFLHAPGSIELLRRGLHVLVEKPMALSPADARRMTQTARDYSRVLSVGLFRRLLPAVRLFRAALDAGQIGEPLNVTAEIGDAYTWQLTTLAGMQRERAGGGILVDMGAHVLDLLLYICGATPTLVHYTDNAGEGVETDCAIELGLSRQGTFIPAHVELSRMRTLANTIRVEGTAGWIEWAFGERSRLRLSTASGSYVDTVSGAPREHLLEARWQDDSEQFGYEGFRAQIDDFVNAITLGTPSQLSGDSVLPSVALMEECYASRKPLVEPWFTDGLPVPHGRSESRPRVLVTGASGFIGARLCERLYFSGEYDVRALIRNPGRAVRLARMPIEFAVGDLSSPDDLTRAMAGCDMVVHAGIGTSWRESERVAVNVEGTTNIVNAAMKAGVKRFVHLSTLALYGDEVTGTITEETAIHPKKEWDYARSKHAAERVVLDAAARGLPAVVHRVAVVYGPHNLTIVARPLQQLAKNRLALVECEDVPSNTIYVDNLCEGIACSLRADSSANGQIFLLSDDDGFTWGEYFGFFASAIGADIQHRARQPSSGSVPEQPSALHRWTRETKDLLTSTEAKALAKRIYNSKPWGTPARKFVERFPNAVRRIARAIRPEEPFIYTPKVEAAEQTNLFVIDPIHARVSADKAARVLGFRAVVPRHRAMELTLAWARHARILPRSARDEVAAGRS